MNYVLSANSEIELLGRLGGGKATNMAKMSQNGFPVPVWFAVSADAFFNFITDNNLKSSLVPKEPFKEFSEKIEELFLQFSISESLRNEIQKNLEALGLNDQFVAVRSSGLDEDSADHSFAGQFSSYLFQKGMDQIENSLKKCWASAYSERGLSYRCERGLSTQDLGVGVVIQKMINADMAGVAFSRHPLKVLQREQMLISSVYGLGEGLVSGALASDNYEYNRQEKSFASEIVEKDKKFVIAPQGGLIQVDVSKEESEKSSLSDQQIHQVAELGIRLEDELKSPQDCEWAFEDNKLYCLQTRPITNLPNNEFFDSSIKGENTTLWDNSNIIESYSGVTTPLTFSFASRTYRQVYIQFCQIMGVPESLVQEREEMFRNMLGLLRGRIYYNLINWYKLVLMLPGSSSNKGFMETMMGVKQQLKPELAGLFEFVKNPPSYSLTHKLWLYYKSLVRFLRINQIVGDFYAHFNQIYNNSRKIEFSKLSLQEQIVHYEYLENQLLMRWHAPIINDYLCMIFFGLLKKLTEKWIASGDVGASLQNDLLCGQGNLESTEPTKMLMRIGREIDQGDPKRREWFLKDRPSPTWGKISKGDQYPEIKSLVLEFLDKYGFRCVDELKLESFDLHDDPSFAINSIMSYVKTKSYNIEEMEVRELEIRRNAEKSIREKISGLRLFWYNWILNNTRKAVANRENLRFARTKVFGIARHLFRGIGSNFVCLKILKDPNDIFYLTVEEIIAFVEGRSLVNGIGQLAESRKVEFENFKKTMDPPERLDIQGAVGVSCQFIDVLNESDLLRSELPVSDDPDLLYGTPCSPGVVEGIVRVVHDMSDAEDLNGEILVTSRTDPGWVPLYPSCSGLLIERGSLLSHSAVVARELGLPTIVGISGGLMKKLKSGQKVRVDSRIGEVRIIHE